MSGQRSYTGLGAKNSYIDTISSELKLKGIFDDADSDRIALYFEYKWTIKSGKIVEFDAVDIIVFDNDNKITTLKIIYDTVISRK
jgi:ketosteroid isomerase-like protein